jgi:hypothetical protein
LNIENNNKIKKIMQLRPNGMILTSKWLHEIGYSYSLLQQYRNLGWLESIGNGAMIRKGDKVDVFGAIYSLQTQLGLLIYPGAKSALAYLGKAHYLTMGSPTLYLCGNTGEKLPEWFVSHDWGVQLKYFTTRFIPHSISRMNYGVNGFDIMISSSIRALMECLYLVPQEQELEECYQFMSSLNNLHPSEVQELLEVCNSIKVKRLFLYLAEKLNHGWFKYLKIERINLGTGDRNIVKGGIYIAKYKITVPKELEKNA